MNNIFGERLTKLRKDKGILQSDVSENLRVSRTSYSKYELGDVKPPMDVIIELANFFNTSADYLLGLNDTPYKENLVNDIKKTINNLLSILNDPSINVYVDSTAVENEQRRIIKMSIEHVKDVIDMLYPSVKEIK